MLCSTLKTFDKVVLYINQVRQRSSQIVFVFFKTTYVSGRVPLTCSQRHASYETEFNNLHFVSDMYYPYFLKRKIEKEHPRKQGQLCAQSEHTVETRTL